MLNKPPRQPAKPTATPPEEGNFARTTNSPPLEGWAFIFDERSGWLYTKKIILIFIL